MRFIQAFVVIAAALVAGANAKLGKCPDVRVQVDFDINRYNGTWYEFERYDVFFERHVTCGKATYTVLPSQHVQVDNVGVKKGKISGRIGEIFTPDTSVPAKLLVAFDVGYLMEGNYWVLLTDYESVSIVYSCRTFYLVHYEVLWILTRDRNGVSEDVRQDLHNRITGYGLDPGRLVQQNQTDCIN